MPSSAELIRIQQIWEGKRGLDQWNTYESRMDRLREEVDEAESAYWYESKVDFLMEVCDVVIFAHSILGQLCDELDLEPEAIDYLIYRKIKQNEKKYPVELFDHHPPEEAIKLAREKWDAEHPKTPGRQFYGGE